MEALLGFFHITLSSPSQSSFVSCSINCWLEAIALGRRLREDDGLLEESGRRRHIDGGLLQAVLFQRDEGLLDRRRRALVTTGSDFRRCCLI
jgi:hypothetical protein